jgi:hypothetical protein
MMSAIARPAGLDWTSIMLSGHVRSKRQIG